MDCALQKKNKTAKQKTRSLQGIFYTPTLTVTAHLNDEAGRVFSHSWLEFCCEQKSVFPGGG